MRYTFEIMDSRRNGPIDAGQEFATADEVTSGALRCLLDIAHCEARETPFNLNLIVRNAAGLEVGMFRLNISGQVGR